MITLLLWLYRYKLQSLTVVEIHMTSRCTSTFSKQIIGHVFACMFGYCVINIRR